QLTFAGGEAAGQQAVERPVQAFSRGTVRHRGSFRVMKEGSATRRSWSWYETPRWGISLHPRALRARTVAFSGGAARRGPSGRGGGARARHPPIGRAPRRSPA